MTVVQERDRIDSTRDMAPLSAAADAVLIDSDGLTAEQTLEEALKLCE
jgi:cytidylate kinase